MKLKMSLWAAAALAIGAVISSAQTITTQPTNQTVMSGSTAMLSVAVSGTGPFTYQWQLNGTNLPNGTITTVAGNGSGSYSGDGGPATNASLYYPEGAALDATGNLFIADFVNNRIRKTTTNGIITTVAGNGSGGYSGDGGPATNATVCPAGVALDSNGNLFIADWNNNRIRMVDTNGIITTVAGNGNPGFSGDGGPAIHASLAYVEAVTVDGSGNLFIADMDNNRIRKVDTNGIITTVAGKGPAVYGSYSGDGGPATNANLNAPYGVAVDATGNLFIADMDNDRIRKVDTNGIITTVAGNGNADYSGDGGPATNACLDAPYGVTVDAFGNVFFADSWNDRIRKVDRSGIITTVAGKNDWGYSGDGDPATNATLNLPSGVALDSTGNLFLADLGNERVRKVMLSASYPMLTLNDAGLYNEGNYSVVITGSGGSVTSSIVTLTVLSPPIIVSQPQSLAVPGGTPASFGVSVVGTAPFHFQWQKNGMDLTDGGNLSGSATNYLLASAGTTNDAGGYSVVITNAWGNVTSSVANLSVVVPSAQTVMPGSTTTFSVVSAGAGPFTFQWQLNGTNLPNGIITTVAGNGTNGFSGDGGPATNAMLNSPWGVSVDVFGNLFLAEIANNRIRKVSTNGVITTIAGNGTNGYSGDGVPATNTSLFFPIDTILDASGNLFIADNNNQRIRKVSTNGIITTVAGNGTNGFSGDGGPATKASLNHPIGIALDSCGNLFISDEVNRRIRKVDTNGFITTMAGNGSSGYYSGDGGPATNASLDSPMGVTLDAFGNLFFADFGNYRIRKVDTNGIITTVAGNGTSGYSGDGGPATNANLNLPFGVCMDAFGNLFISDSSNNRVRKVNVNGIITTVAGDGSTSYSGDGGAAANAGLNAPRGVMVDSSGNLFIADTGNNRVRKVSQFASYPTLTLSNVTTNNAGNYSVIVTTPYGSFTSSVVALNVASSPLISRSALNPDGSLTLNLVTTPNTGSRVLAATNLTPPVIWQPIYTNVAGPAGAWQFTDTNAANHPLRFYRSATP